MSLNREVFHADTAAAEAVIAAGAALGLFGGRRLVLVRGVGDLSAKPAERLRAAVEAARARREGWPTDGTMVVFAAVAGDRRAPGLRLLPEADQVEVRGPSGRAVAGWIRERAQGSGLDLAPEAAQALLDLVGEDLSRLTSELEKVALYAGAERRVSEAVVRALAGETRVHQYWELTQALEGADRSGALVVLERLLSAGEEPAVLLAWVVGYLHNVWRVLAATTEGADARRVAALLKPRRPEWVVERLMARATTVGAAGVADGVTRCYDVERRLKTSSGNPRALLTLLVADLAR